MRVIALSCVSLLLISCFFIPPNKGVAGINGGDDSTIENILSETDEHLTEFADTTLVEMKSEGVELSYSVKEIRAKAGDILLIRYTNKSDMNHNIVLVKDEADIRPVGIAALQAVSSDWIPEKEMHRIIAYTELAHPGETVELSFKVPPPGTYPYICTYSAHFTQMQGRLISTE